MKIGTITGEEMIVQIKKARLSLGISQVEMAKLSGMGRCTYIRMEQGKNTPSFHKVVKVLQVLGKKNQRTCELLLGIRDLPRISA